MGEEVMRNRIMLAAIAVALSTGGCAMDRKGQTGPIKYSKLSCKRLDAERLKTERAVNKLFLSLRKRRAFGDRGDAEVLALWPTLMFLRGADSPDAIRYGMLKADYEALRQVSGERPCRIVFASDVSRTVTNAGRSPDAARINQVVDQETKPQ